MDGDINDYLNKAGETIKNALLPGLDSVKKKVLEVDESAYQVVKTFGLSDSMVMTIKSSLTGAVSQVERLGGGLSNVLKIQQDIGTALNRGVVLNDEAFSKIFAATEVTGQNADYMVRSFKDAGISAYDSSKNMETVVNTARNIGVNVASVSGKVLDNMGQLNRFNFKGGVEGLAKMAAQATNLRIDMSATLGLAEKVFDPEGAIEVAAAMQRLGVAQSDLLDPLRLMDLAQNDPAELQNQLAEMSKQFTKLNSDGNFEILPGAKRQLREISSALGMNYQDLAKMALGSADLDRKMSQIRFPDTFKEEDKKLIANLSEMKDGVATVKFTDSSGEQQTKNVSELNSDDLEQLKKAGETKTLEEIQKEQLDVLSSINASQKALLNKLPTAFAGSKTSEDLLQLGKAVETTVMDAVSNTMGKTGNVSKSIDTSVDALVGGLESLIKGDKSVVQIFGDIGVVGLELKENLETNFNTALLEASKSVTNFSNSNNKFFELLNVAGEKMVTIGNYKPENTSQTSSVTDVEDFIKLPNQIIKPLPQDTLFGGTGFEQFVSKMGNNSGNTPQTPIETKTTADVNLNIKIDAPNQIDTNQILLALENQGVKQKMVESMKEAMYNNGLTSSTSSKSKLMNPYVES